MDNNHTYIGRRIALLRKKEGLTQKELAKRLKTTQSAVARMERGRQNLSTTMLARIGEALGKEIINTKNDAMSLEIEGGKKLSGTIVTNTSKNGAVGLLCASLLNKGTTTLEHMPRIEEVYRIIEVLESIGVSVTWKETTVVIKPPKKIQLKKINIKAAVKTRSILMLIGPLVHLFKHFSLPLPGGCKLGERTIAPHLYALERIGVSIVTKKDTYTIKNKKLVANTIILYESGDTVTENILMAAAKIPGTTTIKFASANYQVQDLCFFLQKLGVEILGIGTTELVVHGKKEINKNVSYSVSEDPTDSMFFITAAVVTGSSITIERCPIAFLELELLKLEKMGFNYSIVKRYVAKNGHTELVDIRTRPSTLTALSEKIAARPYPGLNIDNLPFFAVIATQAKGQTLIHDWVYEKRAIYYTELDRLGAETVLADPHRIFITGPTPLSPAELVCPPALRPATILLIGMLAAKGTSILRNVYSINRGYEDLVSRLNKIGARVRVLQEFTS